jgi:hypothetical protein
MCGKIHTTRPAPVAMPDGSTYFVNRLLTGGKRGNPKLGKSDASDLGYLSVGLTLAPARISGHNVCPKSSAGCRAGCLMFAGRAGLWPRTIHPARIARTQLYFQDRARFMDMLRRELTLARGQAERAGKTLAVRLNLLSDIAWERKHPDLFTTFPDVQFYDYTKEFRRLAAGTLPANYYLTFSRSETNERDCANALDLGYNVAVVFDRPPFPRRYLGFPVVCGETTDLRFLDPSPAIIGLKAKGLARADTTGFVVRPAHPVPTRLA